MRVGGVPPGRPGHPGKQARRFPPDRWNSLPCWAITKGFGRPHVCWNVTKLHLLIVLINLGIFLESSVFFSLVHPISVTHHFRSPGPFHYEVPFRLTMLPPIFPPPSMQILVIAQDQTQRASSKKEEWVGNVFVT